jgi:hypothetical protein
MLFSRSAALLLFFSSSLLRRPWAAAADGGGGAGRRRAPEPREGGTDLQGGIPIRRREGPEEDRRRLVSVSDSGDTTGAALPYGLPFCTSELGYTYCNIGCPSKFYAVDGTGGDMTASTCGGADWDTLLVVRQGSTNSTCSELTCVGMYLTKPPLLKATCCTPHFLANDCCCFPASTTASNDDGCGVFAGPSSVTWSSTEGVTYHIQVTGFDPSQLGTYALQVSGAGLGQTLVEMESPGKKRANGLRPLNMMTSDHAWLLSQGALPSPTRLLPATLRAHQHQLRTPRFVLMNKASLLATMAAPQCGTE